MPAHSSAGPFYYLASVNNDKSGRWIDMNRYICRGQGGQFYIVLTLKTSPSRDKLWICYVAQYEATALPEKTINSQETDGIPVEVDRIFLGLSHSGG